MDYAPQTMPRHKTSEPTLARFPNLRKIRELQLGWEVIDIATRLPNNRPSVASIYRIEQGQPARIANVRRVFDVVNAAMGGRLDPEKEIVLHKPE